MVVQVKMAVPRKKQLVQLATQTTAHLLFLEVTITPQCTAEVLYMYSSLQPTEYYKKTYTPGSMLHKINLSYRFITDILK